MSITISVLYPYICYTHTYNPSMKNTIPQYTIKKSQRARQVNISINMRGEVTVTLPRLVPKLFAHKIIVEKQDWIQKQLQKIKAKQTGDPRLFDYSKKQYERYREEARIFCNERTEYWAQKMNLQYNRIAIKNPKTRWGSCSTKRNLNFNYKIIFLTDLQADYLIVHELAHLIEMNHSKEFWSIVERYIPQYKKQRKELRNNV